MADPEPSMSQVSQATGNESQNVPPAKNDPPRGFRENSIGAS